MDRDLLIKLLKIGLQKGMEFAAAAAKDTENKWDDAAVEIAQQAVQLLLPLFGDASGADAPEYAQTMGQLVAAQVRAEAGTAFE